MWQAYTCRKAISVKHICSSQPSVAQHPHFLSEPHSFQPSLLSEQEHLLSGAFFQEPMFAQGTDCQLRGSLSLHPPISYIKRVNTLISGLPLPSPPPWAVCHQSGLGPSASNVWHNKLHRCYGSCDHDDNNTGGNMVLWGLSSSHLLCSPPQLWLPRTPSELPPSAIWLLLLLPSSFLLLVAAVNPPHPQPHISLQKYKYVFCLEEQNL